MHGSVQLRLRYSFLSSILAVSSHSRCKVHLSEKLFRRTSVLWPLFIIANKATNVVVAWIWHELTGVFIGTQTFSVPASSQNTRSSGRGRSAYTEAGSLRMTWHTLVLRYLGFPRLLSPLSISNMAHWNQSISSPSADLCQISRPFSYIKMHLLLTATKAR